VVSVSLEIVFDDGAALDADAWRGDDFDFWAFDRFADDLFARGEPLHVRARPHERALVGHQLAIRTQRLARADVVPWFARVLATHRALHDLGKPLVRADYDHALDTWQWTLRLDREAPPSVQLAALLHDLERLDSEADARVEHRAPDYQAFKDAHAAAGARRARAVLAGAPAPIAERACALIARHERPGDDPALCALNDADALSFFSLNSAGYLAYFGPEQTASKVAYTLARMSAPARRWLAELRLPAFVRAHLP